MRALCANSRRRSSRPVGQLQLARVDVRQLAVRTAGRMQEAQRIQRVAVPEIDLQHRLPGANRLLALLQRVVVEHRDALRDRLALAGVGRDLEVLLEDVDQLLRPRRRRTAGAPGPGTRPDRPGAPTAPTATPRSRRRRGPADPRAAGRSSPTAAPAGSGRPPRRRPSPGWRPARRAGRPRGPAAPSRPASRPTRRRSARRGCGIRTPARARPRR